jgi:hypothetical protein
MIVNSWKDTAGLPVRQRIRWGIFRWAPGWHETLIHLIDARSRLLGYCNHKPWRGDLNDGGGGYAPWRCGYKRGHDGLHRSNNYVWDDDGATSYVPIDRLQRPAVVNQFAYKHIHGQSYTQRLARARWHRREEARRRAARGGVS